MPDSRTKMIEKLFPDAPTKIIAGYKHSHVPCGKCGMKTWFRSRRVNNTCLVCQGGDISSNRKTPGRSDKSLGIDLRYNG